MLARPQSYKAMTHKAEAEVVIHKAEAKTHEVEVKILGPEAEAEFEAKFMKWQRFEKPKNL